VINSLYPVKSCQQIAEIVSIYLPYFPTKSSPFIGQWERGHNFFDGSIDLQAVVIKNSGQITSPVMGSSHCSLPDLSLLALSVTQQNINPVITLIKSPCQSHS